MVAVANSENAVALIAVAVIDGHVRLNHANHVAITRLWIFAAVNLFVARVGFLLRPTLPKASMFLDRFAVVPHGDQLADRHVSSVSQKARVHHARCLRREQESFGRNDVNADFRLGRVFADFNGRQARLLANLAFHDVKTTIKQGSE